MSNKFDTIRLETAEGIAKLYFNRPEQLNAMNRRMMDEIIEALEWINENSTIEVAVISGEGNAFMAGADIKEYANQSPKEFNAFQKRGFRIYQLIEDSNIPFVASINGYALGGGFEIALACDLVIANYDADMGLPEVHLGLIPGGGGTQRLIQKIGINRVKEMLFLGSQYSGEKMHEWGVVNWVVFDEDLDNLTNQIAQKLIRRPSQSLKALKKLIKISASNIPFETGLEEEGKVVKELYNSDIAKSLIKKFAKK